MQDFLSSVIANPWLRAAGGVLSLTLLAWATNFVVRSQMREDGFKAVIVGSGGDELLAGYPHEYAVPHLAQLLGRGRLFAAAREAAAWPLPTRRALLRRLIRGAPLAPGPR